MKKFENPTEGIQSPTTPSTSPDRIKDNREKKVTVEFSEESLENQMDALVEELNWGEDKARLFMDLMRAYVENRAEELDKEWSDEAINHISNALIDMIIQEEKQINNVSFNMPSRTHKTVDTGGEPIHGRLVRPSRVRAGGRRFRVADKTI